MQLSDWIIIILYLVAMLGIGFFAKGKIQTMDDFILGGKRFGKVALIGTIVATMVGSGMTMGAVGTAYNNGSTSTVPWMYFGFSVGLIVMGLIAPQVRETNARSIAEIMNIKFGKPARLAMACLVTFYAVAMVAINIAGLRTVIINCFGFPADKLVLATVIAAGIASSTPPSVECMPLSGRTLRSLPSCSSACSSLAPSSAFPRQAVFP